jgi:hypothetical protein
MTPTRTAAEAAATLTKLQRAVMEAMAAGGASEEQAVYFRTIKHHCAFVDVPIRRVVRTLARKGLTEYQRGLFSDDGMIAGAGYGFTRLGIEVSAILAAQEPSNADA